MTPPAVIASGFVPEDDYLLDSSKQYAMDLARAMGDTCIVYEEENGQYGQRAFIVRTMSEALGRDAPGREVGRAGLDQYGDPFWSTLQ